MSKFLIVILAVVAVWWLVRGFRRDKPGRGAADPSPQQMVACGHCGLYLPRSEAVTAEQSDPAVNKFYCSEEHRRLAD